MGYDGLNWLTKLPITTISEITEKHGVNYELLCAIIAQESAGNALAMRYEPAWRYYWFPRETASRLHISEATETQLQMFSYGLAQVMGAVAREHGFAEPMFKLLDVSTNIEYACKYLKFLMSHCEDEPTLIACYNGGLGARKKLESGMYRNQSYVDSVSRYLRELRKLI